MSQTTSLSNQLTEVIVRNARMNDRTVEVEILSSAQHFVSPDFLHLALHQHQPLSDEMIRFLQTLSESDQHLTRITHAQESDLTQPQVTSLFSWLTRFLNRTSINNYTYSWEDYLEFEPNGYRMPSHLRQVVQEVLTP